MPTRKSKFQINQWVKRKWDGQIFVIISIEVRQNGFDDYRIRPIYSSEEEWADETELETINACIYLNL